MSIIHDIQQLSREEIEELYSVEFQEDGTIWDPIERRLFNSLGDLADSLEDYVSGGFTKTGHKHHFSDYD